MRQKLQDLLMQAIAIVQQNTELSLPAIDQINVTRTRDRAHGDFTCNIAMVLAKTAKMPPFRLATLLVEHLADSDLLAKVEIAGPGFINFFLAQGARLRVISHILQTKEDYGRSEFGAGKSVLLEFVSANPTGPLHVGHGRGAAYGSVLANLLAHIGYRVEREYYVNDAGRQMDILTLSVWLRYLQQCGITVDFPENLYQGDYVVSIAKSLLQEKQRIFLPPQPFNSDVVTNNDPEKLIDALIVFAKSVLGNEHYGIVMDFGLQRILGNIREDLEGFGVHFERWFSERSLLAEGNVQRCIDKLRSGDFVYQQAGALWFRSTALGDEKDRVIVRDNGQTTYFASDIAYHMDKFSRGYHQIINIWGADHHGYIARLRAVLRALGEDDDVLKILLVQFATLYRGAEKLQMSSRSGEFVTLRELQDEVGRDPARFFYVMRKCEQHLDFDLELAKAESDDNPIYYIHYAHARICSVLNKFRELGVSTDIDVERCAEHLDRLTEQIEERLIAELSRYPDVVHAAATGHEPHQISYYLGKTANIFHSYYNSCRFIVDCEELRNARLMLILATKQVLFNGLGLLGISAPEHM